MTRLTSTRQPRALLLATFAASLAGCRSNREPSLPRAQAHCASGLGGDSLCAEWAGQIGPQQQVCTRLNGNWADNPCPKGVSSTGGTCIVRSPERTGTLHYGSAWKVSSVNARTSRAEAHCLLQHGTFKAP